MHVRHIALALVLPLVATESHAAARQLQFTTCVANARGQYYQFGPQVILPDARRSLVGKTLVYFPYEPPISLTSLKVGASVGLTFSDTTVEVEQAGEKYTDRIDFMGSTWCQQNRLTGQRECLAVLAKDPSLQSPLQGTDIPGVGAIHGFLGRWLDNDFCKASVVGVFRLSTSSAQPAQK